MEDTATQVTEFKCHERVTKKTIIRQWGVFPEGRFFVRCVVGDEHLSLTVDKKTKTGASKGKDSADQRKRKAGDQNGTSDEHDNPTAAEKLANRTRIIARKRNARREGKRGKAA